MKRARARFIKNRTPGEPASEDNVIDIQLTDKLKFLLKFVIIEERWRANWGRAGIAGDKKRGRERERTRKTEGKISVIGEKTVQFMIIVPNSTQLPFDIKTEYSTKKTVFND